MNRRAKELYQELGPTLFARACRVLKDEKLAQQVTLAVVEELAQSPKLTRLELARRGRALVKHHCEARGAKLFDSLMPGAPPIIKPSR